MTPLAEAIQALRLRLGLSHDKFGAKLGTSRVTIIRWEKDENVPNGGYRDKLIALGIPAALFDEVKKIPQRGLPAEVALMRQSISELKEAHRSLLQRVETLEAAAAPRTRRATGGTRAKGRDKQ